MPSLLTNPPKSSVKEPTSRSRKKSAYLDEHTWWDCQLEAQLKVAWEATNMLLQEPWQLVKGRRPVPYGAFGGLAAVKRICWVLASVSPCGLMHSCLGKRRRAAVEQDQQRQPAVGLQHRRHRCRDGAAGDAAAHQQHGASRLQRCHGLRGMPPMSAAHSVIHQLLAHVRAASNQRAPDLADQRPVRH